MRTALLAAAALLAAVPLHAQDERALRDYFEGRTVVLKLDMPGTEAGVDIYPEGFQTLDYPKYATRLKRDGTALRSGESAIVTKVKVKGKLIEFQLGGGGYGTFGDDVSGNVNVAALPKSKRESELDGLIRDERDQTQRRRLERERDDLRTDRQREDRRNQAVAQTAAVQKQQLILERRRQSGSRFNLRYDEGVPASALTPEGVRNALEKYVQFPDDQYGDAAAPAIRRGMMVEEVEELLGPAVKADERTEGKYRVSIRTYANGRQRVTAEFIEGVMVTFTRLVE